MQSCGSDVTFEQRKEVVVQNRFDLCEVRSDNHFREDRSGGDADRAAITFETSGFDDLIVELQFDPDAITAERIEILMRDIRSRKAAIVAGVAEVVQDNLAVERSHSLLFPYQPRSKLLSFFQRCRRAGPP